MKNIDTANKRVDPKHYQVRREGESGPRLEVRQCIKIVCSVALKAAVAAL